MNRGKYILLFIVPLILGSCSASRNTSTKRPDGIVLQPETEIVVSPVANEIVHISSVEQRYIDLYGQMAVEEMHRSGVPASITLAQGMIESNYGRSTLATNANNHFGIKCHDWSGKSIKMDDDAKDECFRKYDNVKDSFRDHSEFLSTRQRYSFLFDLKQTDYEGWAKGLKQAGYATNPQYANMLIAKIEELELYKFDDILPTSNTEENAVNAVAIVENSNTVTTEEREEISPLDNSSNTTTNRETESETRSEENIPSIYLSDEQPPIVRARASRTELNNGIPYIIVAAGETKKSIAKEFNLLSREIAKYNELDSDFIPYSGQIIYLQPKRGKAAAGINTHTVQEGETLYYISQLYGVKHRSLLRINKFSENHTLLQGDIIKLR